MYILPQYTIESKIIDFSFKRIHQPRKSMYPFLFIHSNRKKNLKDRRICGIYMIRFSELRNINKCLSQHFQRNCISQLVLIVLELGIPFIQWLIRVVKKKLL
ncbi:hypothetical protein ACJX0J_007088, partial [Zea mays]